MERFDGKYAVVRGSELYTLSHAMNDVTIIDLFWLILKFFKPRWGWSALMIGLC